MDISWTLLRELEDEYGDAFFLLDLNAFRNNYTEFLEAFRSIYPKTNVAYSYKTNYIPRLCQSVNAMGGYAEVVSSMEYELALRIGVSPHRIIFNGPYKTEADLERALLAGAMVNLDGLHEVALVEAIARNVPERPITVGLRCNFDVGTGQISRFGFDVEGEELKRAYETLGRVSNCRVGGLHCHFSTAHRSVESYTLRTKRMLELSALYWGTDTPQFINLGGGFSSQMSAELQAQFSHPMPTYQEYAAAIATQVAQAFHGHSGPELILEPGLALTANILQFVAKVIHVKTVRSRTVALVSGSIHNIKPTLHGKNLPMRVIRPGATPEVTNAVVDIVGYTCMEHDCLYTGYEGSLASGDYAVFENVGAYTIVMKPPFIRPAPGIIGYDATSKILEPVKHREAFDQIFSTYVF